MMLLRKRLLSTALGVAGVVAPVSVASAQTVVPSATVSLGAGYSTNPFLSAGDDTGAANAQLSIAPQLQIIDNTDQATISGFYNRTEYASKYGGNDGYGVAINAASQLDPRTSINFNAGLDSQILGTQNGFVSVPAIGSGAGTGTGVDPGTGIGTGTGTGTGTGAPIVTTPIVGGVGGDIGLVGLNQRRTSLSAAVGLNFRPDERSTWTFGANAQRNSYPDNGGLATNFRTYGANIGYSRSLSEKDSIGLQVAGTITDYSDAPNARILTPRVTYNRLLSERWTLDLAVGASIVDDGSGSSVQASATGSLCRASERGQFCLTASREPSINGFGGARSQTSVAASYSYQLAEATSIAASASYQQTQSGFSTLPGAIQLDDQSFVSADVSVNRRLARRLSAYATVNYRDVNGLGLPVDADVGGRVGLSLTIGGR